MRIRQVSGSPCVESDPIIIEVLDCPEGVTPMLTTVRSPDGSGDATITDIGDGRYTVTAGVPGAYIIRAECCGPDS